MEQNKNMLPEYEALAAALSRVNSQLSAAECHGLLTGALNTEDTTLISRFFSEDPESLKEDGQFAELISQIVHLTVEGFKDEDFNFQLLLPSDDIPETLNLQLPVYEIHIEKVTAIIQAFLRRLSSRLHLVR